MNKDQFKHLAKICDVLALASIAPVLSDLTGIQKIQSLNGTEALIFISIGLILEINALVLLGGQNGSD